MRIWTSTKTNGKRKDATHSKAAKLNRYTRHRTALEKKDRSGAQGGPAPALGRPAAEEPSHVLNRPCFGVADSNHTILDFTTETKTECSGERSGRGRASGK